MNNVHYDKILNYLENLENIQVFDVLIEDIHKTLGFSVSDIKLVFEDLIETQVGCVYEEKFYLLNHKPYALGQFKAVRENFGFVETGIQSIYVGKDDFNDVLDLDDVIVEIVSSEKEFGKIEGVVKHHKKFILGTIVQKGSEIEFKTFDKKIFKPIEWTRQPQGVSDNDRIIVR